MKKCLCLFFLLILTAATAFPETVEGYLDIGERYFAESRFHEAHTAVMEAIRLNPDNELANFHLGVIYYRLNDVSLALEYLSRAIELDNTLAEAYIWRGRIYNESLNDLARTLENYNMAVYLEPENDRYHRHRAFFLSDIGDYTQALVGFNRAIEINPLNYENFQQRGVFFARRGLCKHALNDFNRAIVLNSDDVESLLSRGNMLISIGKYEEAIEDFDTAMRLDSTNFEGHLYRGLANINLERYHAAILDFTEVIRIDPNNSDAFYNRSTAYKYLATLANDPVQAWEYWQRAQEDEAAAHWLDSQR